MARRKAFTLVELLVVIAIIAVLISILIPFLSRAKEQARRAVCQSNLHQNGVALLMYAGENRGKLPQHLGNSYWLFDIPLDTRDAMLRFGCVRRNFYCPTNASTQNVDDLWNYPSPSSPIHCATGYQWLFRRPSPVMPPMFYNRQYLETWNGTQTLIINGMSVTRTPADIELATDMVNSRQGTPEDFDGAMGGHPFPHHTPHKTGPVPDGGNILFLDGHVQFRPFNEMMLQQQHSGDNFYF